MFQRKTLFEITFQLTFGIVDVLQSNVPKTFVNLVSVLNIAPVREMNRNTFCTQLHKYACGCGAFPATPKDEDALNQRYLNYTMLLRDLAWSGRYDVTDQFAVVWQPFLANYTAPRDADGQIDLTYFAPDCFHFSSKLHGKYIFHALNSKIPQLLLIF